MNYILNFSIFISILSFHAFAESSQVDFSGRPSENIEFTSDFPKIKIEAATVEEKYSPLNGRSFNDTVTTCEFLQADADSVYPKENTYLSQKSISTYKSYENHTESYDAFNYPYLYHLNDRQTASIVGDATEDFTKVPESKTYVLLLAGLGTLIFITGRRKNFPN